MAADGRTVWLRDIVRVQRDEKGKALKLTGLTVDVGAQKQQSRQLAQSEKMAGLGRLAGKITHDFNNLLMILSGYGEELLSNLPSDHPSREDAEEIVAAAQRLSAITNELLVFTRRPNLLPKVFDLNSLVGEMEGRLRQQLGDDIQLDLHLGPGVGQVNADSEAIANSILRLAEQARDAMPDGGRITISTAVTELTEGSPSDGESVAPGQYVTLTVSDTGPQLDEETRTRLFEPFFSSPRTSKALPGIYRVVKKSGGDIVVRSGAEAGADFTIYMPRHPEPAEVAAPAVAVPTVVPVVPAPKPMETVLVVEDEKGIRALMRKILRKQGYNVLEASRGEEALRISAEHKEPIDLLLTDVVMPQMSGRELADQLKKARPSMKVLFVSGYSDDDLVQYGPLPSGSAFLQKPFSLAALLEKTRNVLNGGSGNH
jgi:signal transduction histidine kinase/CheY-like chemotaxis protein